MLEAITRDLVVNRTGEHPVVPQVVYFTFVRSRHNLQRAVFIRYFVDH